MKPISSRDVIAIAVQCLPETACIEAIITDIGIRPLVSVTSTLQLADQMLMCSNIQRLYGHYQYNTTESRIVYISYSISNYIRYAMVSQ